MQINPQGTISFTPDGYLYASVDVNGKVAVVSVCDIKKLKKEGDKYTTESRCTYGTDANNYKFSQFMTITASKYVLTVKRFKHD